MMLRTVGEVDWDAQVQPPWNARGEIVRALRALAAASPSTGQRSYCDMVYAVGNNHEGMYWPVAVAVVPFLGEILESGGPVARARTLDVLIDLVASFEPDADYEHVECVDGPAPLRKLLLAQVRAHSSGLLRPSDRPGSDEEARLARDLRELLRDP